MSMRWSDRDTVQYRCLVRHPHSPHRHTIDGAEFVCPGVRAVSSNRRVPQHRCASGCGRRVFREHTVCDRCIREQTQDAVPESIRATIRMRKGKCVVCGGPFPDGSGCEFCPAVDADASAS